MRVRSNFWSFLVVYMIFSMTHGVQGSYTSSILTTLERKFNLPSIVSGTVVTVSTLGYLTSALVVSFFLPERHRVRVFAISMLCTGLCSIFYFMPHFMYPTVRSELERNNNININPKDDLLCFSGNKSFSDTPTKHQNSDEPNWIAVMLFCISEIFQGIAGAPIWTIGITMIDDHTPVTLASKLIGFMFFMRFLSPVISFGMGSFFLTYPDDLKETSLTTKDPEWIGAWWLGFMVCFIINVSISIPTFFLSSKFKKIGYHKKSKGKNIVKDKNFNRNSKNYSNEVTVVKIKPISNDGIENVEINASVANQDREEEVESNSMCINDTKVPVAQDDNMRVGGEGGDGKEVDFLSSEQPQRKNDDDHVDEDEEENVAIGKRSFKELFITIKRICENPTYVILCIGVCFDCFVLPFYSFLPKYVEVHFKQSAWKASLLGGMVPAFAGGLMSYVGGIISGKFKVSKDKGVNSNVRFAFGMSIVNIMIMTSLMFIPCIDNYLPYGYDDATQSVSTNSSCNMDCACVVGQFDPICGPRDQWYTSPCQAGCTAVEHLNHHEMFSNCSCIDEAPFIAKSGYCGDECPYMLSLYIACMVAFCFSVNSYNVAITNATLKCVPKRDKPVALALQTVVICITLFPSPMLYGGFIDLTCILWKNSADPDLTGHCLAYEHYYFRISLHICLFCCRVMVVLLYGLTYFFSSRKLRKLQNEVKKTSFIVEVK